MKTAFAYGGAGYSGHRGPGKIKMSLCRQTISEQDALRRAWDRRRAEPDDELSDDEIALLADLEDREAADLAWERDHFGEE